MKKRDAREGLPIGAEECMHIKKKKIGERTLAWG